MAFPPPAELAGAIFPADSEFILTPEMLPDAAEVETALGGARAAEHVREEFAGSSLEDAAALGEAALEAGGVDEAMERARKAVAVLNRAAARAAILTGAEPARAEAVEHFRLAAADPRRTIGGIFPAEGGEAVKAELDGLRLKYGRSEGNA